MERKEMFLEGQPRPLSLLDNNHSEQKTGCSSGDKTSDPTIRSLVSLGNIQKLDPLAYLPQSLLGTLRLLGGERKRIERGSSTSAYKES